MADRKKKTWIIGIGGSLSDDVFMHTVYGTRSQVKDHLIKLIKEEIDDNKDEYDFGSDTKRLLKDDDNEGIYGYTVFSDFHTDYKAIPLNNLDEEVV